MELKIKRSDFKRQIVDSSGSHELQFLKVEIKEDNSKKSQITNTLKLDKKNSTMRDVLNILTKKYRVKNVEEYGFWHTKENRWIDLNTPLSECNLEHMEILSFSKKKE